MGLTWLALGDSITNATGATTYDKGYLHQTRMQLLNAGSKHKLVKCAIGGITSGDLFTKYKYNGAICDPDLVTILIGTNDIAQSVSTATFQTNLQSMIDDIRNMSQNGQCKIVLMTILWRPDFASTIPSYNSIIQTVATNKNVLVCDTYPAFNTTADLSADNVHPVNSGHLKVANILAPVLNGLDVWNNTRSRG